MAFPAIFGSALALFLLASYFNEVENVNHNVSRAPELVTTVSTVASIIDASSVPQQKKHYTTDVKSKLRLRRWGFSSWSTKAQDTNHSADNSAESKEDNGDDWFSVKRKPKYHSHDYSSKLNKGNEKFETSTKSEREDHFTAPSSKLNKDNVVDLSSSKEIATGESSDNSSKPNLGNENDWNSINSNGKDHFTVHSAKSNENNRGDSTSTESKASSHSGYKWGKPNKENLQDLTLMKSKHTDDSTDHFSESKKDGVEYLPLTTSKPNNNYTDHWVIAEKENLDDFTVERKMQTGRLNLLKDAYEIIIRYIAEDLSARQIDVEEAVSDQITWLKLDLENDFQMKRLSMARYFHKITELLEEVVSLLTNSSREVDGNTVAGDDEVAVLDMFNQMDVYKNESEHSRGNTELNQIIKTIILKIQLRISDQREKIEIVGQKLANYLSRSLQDQLEFRPAVSFRQQLEVLQTSVEHGISRIIGHQLFNSLLGQLINIDFEYEKSQIDNVEPLFRRFEQSNRIKLEHLDKEFRTKVMDFQANLRTLSGDLGSDALRELQWQQRNMNHLRDSIIYHIETRLASTMTRQQNEARGRAYRSRIETQLKQLKNLLSRGSRMGHFDEEVDNLKLKIEEASGQTGIKAVLNVLDIYFKVQQCSFDIRQAFHFNDYSSRGDNYESQQQIIKQLRNKNDEDLNRLELDVLQRPDVEEEFGKHIKTLKDENEAMAPQLGKRALEKLFYLQDFMREIAEDLDIVEVEYDSKLSVEEQPNEEIAPLRNEIDKEILNLHNALTQKSALVEGQTQKLNSLQSKWESVANETGFEAIQSLLKLLSLMDQFYYDLRRLIQQGNPQYYEKQRHQQKTNLINQAQQQLGQWESYLKYRTDLPEYFTRRVSQLWAQKEDCSKKPTHSAVGCLIAVLSELKLFHFQVESTRKIDSLEAEKIQEQHIDSLVRRVSQQLLELEQMVAGLKSSITSVEKRVSELTTRLRKLSREETPETFKDLINGQNDVLKMFNEIVNLFKNFDEDHVQPTISSRVGDSVEVDPTPITKPHHNVVDQPLIDQLQREIAKQLADLTSHADHNNGTKLAFANKVSQLRSQLNDALVDTGSDTVRVLLYLRGNATQVYYDINQRIHEEHFQDDPVQLAQELKPRVQSRHKYLQSMLDYLEQLVHRKDGDRSTFSEKLADLELRLKDIEKKSGFKAIREMLSLQTDMHQLNYDFMRNNSH